MFHWLIRNIVVGPWLRNRVRAELIGLDNIPKTGGYHLAVGSHKTEIESAVVGVYLRRRPMYFYAKAEYWRKGKLMAWFMTAIRQIPMDRADPVKADEAIDVGAKLLRKGEIVSVFPEGTRSPDELLHGGYPSFVISVIRSGGNVPVIPIGLIGFEKASPTGSGLIPNRANVKIVIGKPIWLTDAERKAIKFAHLDSGEFTRAKKVIAAPIARRVTNETMKSIADLCGKSYTPKRLPIPHR